ncbi:MAG TPA: VanZ family protein [Bacteroidales bacterium]|nr:VanZ family protein [Bacteroidales bacterium]HRR16718.1 VanZ family protein [Bacteroidales bacterium]HRT48458.1 VanZ family protein [Bacteroidales bacterium]
MGRKFIENLKPFSERLMLLWIFAILILTFIPFFPESKTTLEFGKIEIRLDYIFHIIIYIIGIFICFLWRADSNFNIRLPVLFLIMFFFTLIATGQEFLQKIIPYRAFNINDIVSNITGVFIGIPFSMLIFRQVRQRNKYNKQQAASQCPNNVD